MLMDYETAKKIVEKFREERPTEYIDMDFSDTIILDGSFPPEMLKALSVLMEKDIEKWRKYND